ncbi:MAG: response regulator [Alphaproteobacteria bacterium]|nr:response regulator [Alphaproteobacteria bacterium]
MRLLLVEDDEMLGRATRQGLEGGFAVDWVKNAEDAELALKSTDYGLLVLDVNLPGMSGLEFLKKLRSEKNATPCLLLTARDAVHQRVEGLDAGADDYLVKPFDLDELIARCRALMRRAQGRAAPVIACGDVVFDPAARSVERGGKSVALSARELSVFEALMSNIGRTLSKDQIHAHIYDWSNEEIESNTVEVHVSALRRKLGRNFIKTIRGVGYVIPK